MSQENPFASPAPSDLPGDRVLIRSILAVFGSAAIGAILGLFLGLFLGVVMPGYYRGVFSVGSDPDFDPAVVGMGLGTTQGARGGAAVGVVLVALFCWYRSRMMRIERIR